MALFDSLTDQTNEWPSGVTNRAATNELSPEVSGDLDSDSTVAELAAEIKPRYHIAGSKGIFYSREPYYNDGVVHVTRFIGLAAVGNKDKQKFIHAISPTPASMMTGIEISAKPTNTTLSPYNEDRRTNSKESVKRPVDNTVETQYWRYEVKKQRQGDGEQDKLCFKFLSSDCPRGEKCHFRHDPDAREQYKRGVCFDFLNKGRCDRGPDCQFEHKLLDESSKRRRLEGGSINRSKECWFCLSSPNVEADMIVSIGEHFYCALAKGPLVDDHVLVIPIEHLHSTLSAPPECERELQKFRSSLRLYSKNQGKETVFFELISKRGTHANLQAVPVPLTKASALKNIFIFAAKKLGFDFEVVDGKTIEVLSDDLIALLAKDNSDGKRLSTLQSESKFGFFYAELPDHTILSHSIEEQENFPVQFGREVVAGLLKMPEKADWRNCKLSKEEELKLVETFKSQFELEQR
ncbi:Zinc finger CCCH domain-containing protein [Drosera capensis]